VLLAEDEPMLRGMLTRMLGRLGYHVIEAGNGEEALRRAREHKGPIHLLLTDVVMPLMSGWELAERLREVRPETRAIFMSGYADGVPLGESMREKGAMVLAKPFDESDLARRVREVLDA